ncbi:GntR family transcriptional regulator [Paenibacillus validus]|uniref:UTRA domain-containing protein n=1 Tax=Paenibacillus validus TaxID=44253 RepID=A0A7X3CWA7_9BACL|nr:MULTISPECIES: GntR family transcriptional regulator [Paenibacillus]MED4602121.1 GntR family transcriptional regulator [Paenibacillus validus]MED4607422.1 GntR family transcriptional regulator [Paenibacillus validus]MUG73974.1 UTRA domain-containing protein [Paenibacillus validus]
MTSYSINPNSVDPNKNIALYQQVKDALLKLIHNQVWRPNSLIPTEQELMETFKVSRTTIRQAINMLVQEGLLEKRQGKGTIVLPLKLVGNLGRLRGFAEEVMERGLVPHSQLIRAEFVSMLNFEKSVLQVPENESVLIIERIRLANDVPIALERSCWPEKIGQILMKYDLNSAKYYEILENHGTFLKHAKEKISAINATLHEADLLGIRAGEALLEMTRLSFGIDDAPMEYTRTKFRSDQYSYDIELTR